MTPTSKPASATLSAEFKMSNESIIWDKSEKGFLTDAERNANNMDVDLKEDNNKLIKKKVYGLAFFFVLLLFIGTVAAGTGMMQQPPFDDYNSIHRALKEERVDDFFLSSGRHLSDNGRMLDPKKPKKNDSPTVSPSNNHTKSSAS